MLTHFPEKKSSTTFTFSFIIMISSWFRCMTIDDRKATELKLLYNNNKQKRCPINSDTFLLVINYFSFYREEPFVGFRRDGSSRLRHQNRNVRERRIL